MKTLLPPIQPPDQRYWRARANRRVRSRRVLNLARRWGVVLAIQIVVAAVTAAAVAFGCHGLLESDSFRLSTIEVEGVEHASAAAIRARLAGLAGQPLFDIPLSVAEALASEDPWVVGCTIKRVVPDTLLVRIEERRPVAAAIVDGQPVYIDGAAQPILTALQPAIDVPILTGIEEVHDTAGLERGVAALQRLRQASPAFHARLSELELGHADRLVARLTRPGPDLWLDPEQVERNVDRYLSLGDSLERQVGSLQRVDLRWNGRFALTPMETQAPSRENR